MTKLEPECLTHTKTTLSRLPTGPVPQAVPERYQALWGSLLRLQLLLDLQTDGGRQASPLIGGQGPYVPNFLARVHVLSTFSTQSPTFLWSHEVPRSYCCWMFILVVIAISMALWVGTSRWSVANNDYSSSVFRILSVTMISVCTDLIDFFSGWCQCILRENNNLVVNRMWWCHFLLYLVHVIIQ